MSYTNEQLAYIEDARADFDYMINREDFSSAQALIDSLGEQGYETEALFLFQALNRAKNNSPKTEPDDYSNSTLETYGD